MRFCEADNCNQPVWGTCKISRRGYCKRHQNLREDFDPATILQKAIKKQRKNAVIKDGRALRVLAVTDDGNREMVEKHKTKSELLREADSLFSTFIKNRDIKKGACYCPCCNKAFNPEGVEVNCMHFIDRDVYDLRYDECFAHAGHASCNRNQHYNPKGKEYQNFRAYLVKKLGEEEVAEAEVSHRKINKITEQQLKTVIEHYSTT